MKTDESNPHDWFLLARERLEKADALYKQFGPSYSGVELLEEAVERYLKGYLVANRWPLNESTTSTALSKLPWLSIRDLQTSRNWRIPLQSNVGSSTIQGAT